MTRPTLADFELVLGPQTAREIAANAFAMSLAPSIEQRRERAAVNLRAAGIDPDDCAAVRKAYEDALFDACAGGC